MKIKDWLRAAPPEVSSLAARVELQPSLQSTAPTGVRLDKELILCYNLGIERAELILRENELLPPEVLERANTQLTRRLAGEPLAYILGFSEFFGRRFRVTPDVLIPRPETEALTELVLRLARANHWRCLHEVGTGSGVIAATLKLEQPELLVSASDISLAALAIAQENAATLGAEVDFFEADLLEWPAAAQSQPQLRPQSQSRPQLQPRLEDETTLDAATPDAIVANLPYVDRDWDWISPELKYEPAEALFAEDGGLALIKKLILQTKERYPQATLILEADPCQSEPLTRFAETQDCTTEVEGFAFVLRPEATV